MAAGATLLHPFDDPVVIAAQGTVGLELAADAPELTDVLVSVGGGGLISGVATALRARLPGVRVWGVETAGADAMSRALAAGAPVPITPDLDRHLAVRAARLGADLRARRQAGRGRARGVRRRRAARGAGCSPSRPRCGRSRRPAAWCRPRPGCSPRLGPEPRLGLVLCGGNVTAADLAGWESAPRTRECCAVFLHGAALTGAQR